MNAKSVLVSTLFALSAFATGPALAQDSAADDDAFARMHEKSEAFHATSNLDERHALMREHMELMKRHMHKAGGMMGGGMMADQDTSDAAALQSRMGPMHRMMMEMLEQQDMMLEMMQGASGDASGTASENANDNGHGEHHE